MEFTSPLRTLTLAVHAPVWSKGGTNPGASDLFVFSSDDIMQIAPLIKQLRTTLTVANATENLECKTAFQATDDGCSWDTALDIDQNTHSGNGTWTSDWYTNPVNFKRGIRFGVVASQGGTSTLVEQGRVTLIVDIELKG